MLSKLKKKKGESSVVKVPAWHQDFRNTDGLPDMKPIRTAFFVNGVAILIAIAMLMQFAYQEFQLYGLRSQIEDWQREIDQNTQPSNVAVAKFKDFQKQEKKIKEAGTFLKAPLNLSGFLLRMGEILPENVIIDTIDWRNNLITLRGSVEGSPDEASGRASGFVETLDNDEVFGPIFEDANLTSLMRNPATGLLSLEVQLEFAKKK